MPEDKKVTGITKTMAEDMLTAIEKDDTERVDEILEQMTSAGESELFQELGKLTRELHDSLAGFQLDSRIADLTENDIPDAKERLNYVVTMTEQAAHSTLGAVEESLPLTESLDARIKTLGDSWRHFRKKEMSSDDFRSLCLDLDAFFDEAGGQMKTINGNLSDVLMAQGYQDITGQIIRRVIGLVQEVEGNLVTLVRITGQKFSANVEKKEEEEDKIKAVGPAVPGVDTSDVVSNQDDVDDLLSSLGF